MSDMDEQETLVNESNSQDYDLSSGCKLRTLKLFQPNTSNENISFDGFDAKNKSNLSNNSSIGGSVIHYPKEFPKINPSGAITNTK